MTRSILPYFDKFTANPKDYKVITVKVNKIESSDDENLGRILGNVINYIKSNGVSILAMSCGHHANGRNAIPHVHLHMICDSFIIGKKCFTQNISRHREKYYQNNNLNLEDLENVSMKFSELSPDKPSWQILSYPLKEGNPITYFMEIEKVPIDEQMLEFLRNIGVDIYNKATGMHERNEACEERKRKTLLEMFRVSSEYHEKAPFGSLVEFLDWAEYVFIESRPIDEQILFDSFQKNIMPIARKLKLVKYRDLILKKYNL